MRPFVSGSAKVAGHLINFPDRVGFLHSVDEIFSQQVYRFKASSNAPHIIDAGANMGLSILFFKMLYPQCTIEAYEPDSDLFELLHRNVGHFEGVTLHRAAAWTSDSELTFYTEGSLAGSAEMDFLSQGKRVTVPAKRLRDAIVRKKPDFLKIDVEGAENYIIPDIADCLPGIDHLFFEYHSTPGKEQRIDELLSVVKKAGYRVSINGTHGPLLPFVQKVPYGFDLQMNVFCFRQEVHDEVE